MKRSSRGSKKNKMKPRVKNRLTMGDYKPAMMLRDESKAQGNALPRLEANDVKRANFYIDRTKPNTTIRLADGSKFKRKVRAKGDRAAKVYGSTRKAMRQSFVTDPVTGKKKKAKVSGNNVTFKVKDRNTSGTNSIGQVFSPERPRSRRRKDTFI